MARERIIKDPLKRGKLTKSQVKRAVEKVVLGKHGGSEAISSTQHSKTRLRLGVLGVELQDSRILQAFVESGLLPPDVPLTNHSIELRLWVPWPPDRSDFSLYKINPETGQRYGGASGLMMEVRHTETHFSPELPETVWEETPRVHWETLSEHVQDFIDIIIRTQHLRERNWRLMPDGDTNWIEYFNAFMDFHKSQKEKFKRLKPQRVFIGCVGGFSSPLEMLTQCLHKNLDQNTNITEITMVVEDCVKFEVEELRQLVASTINPINLDIKIASLEQMAEILQEHRQRGINLSYILPAKNRTYMLKSLRTTYIDYLAALGNGNNESRGIILDEIRSDCNFRIERLNRFCKIEIDFSFSKEELDKLIHTDHRILKAVNSNRNIPEAISNGINVLEEMLNDEIHQKIHNQGDIPLQTSPANSENSLTDLKEIAKQFMKEYETFDNSVEARQFHIAVESLEDALIAQRSSQQIRILVNRWRVSFQDFVDAEKWKKPLETLEVFLQSEGVDEFVEKCHVPKVDGDTRPLRVEIEEFKTLVEIFEVYNKLTSVDVKPSKSQLEQWKAEFKSLLLKLFTSPEGQKVVQFVTEELLENMENIKDNIL